MGKEKVRWRRVEGWIVKNPEVDRNNLKIFMPYGIDEVIIMPGEDALIPTGLWFPGFCKDYYIIPVHHSYPNKQSDVLGVYNGKLGEKCPFLHMSVISDAVQLFLHIINLGTSELIVRPGKTIAYLMFVEILGLSEKVDDEEENEVTGC